MGKRTRVRNMYLHRDKKGRFKDWTNIGRSIHADARQKARTHPTKTGYGHTGDYNKGTRTARKKTNQLKALKVKQIKL